MAENTIAVPENKSALTKKEETRTPEEYITPMVDIYETDEGLTLLADLPGVSSEGLDVKVKDDILTIQAHAEHQSNGNSLYREFDILNYFRQFQLSERVDTNKISAQFQEGVLKLYLPKAEEAKPRKIEVITG
jgi:HSP20 family molecular chaperone IbpA